MLPLAILMITAWNDRADWRLLRSFFGWHAGRSIGRSSNTLCKLRTSHLSRFRQYGRYWRFEHLSARSHGQRGDPHRTVHANSCDGRQHFGIWRRLQCIADALRRFPRCRARKIGRPHPHIEASRSMRRHPAFAKARHGDDADCFTNSERFDECRVAGCHRIAIHGATLTGNWRLIGAARKTLRLK